MLFAIGWGKGENPTVHFETNIANVIIGTFYNKTKTNKKPNLRGKVEGPKVFYKKARNS